MEKKVIKKMTRYIELSKKFTKTDSEILAGNKPLQNTDGMILTGKVHGVGSSNTVFFGNGTFMLDDKEIYVDNKGNVKAKDPKKPLTRGQEHKAKEILKLEKDATLMDEYDEYIRLRKTLLGYFEGVDKLLEE